MSDIGKANIQNININYNRKLVIVKFKTCESNEIFLLEFIKISVIINWKVNCRLPRSQAITYGVIGPFGNEVTDAELTLELTETGYEDAVASRIIKPKGKIKTSMFKVALVTSQLPEFIYLPFRRFKVSLYIDRPWQYYRCQQFGHNAKDCHAKIKCVVYSGNHFVKDCQSHSPKCSNCGNGHTANYGGCSYMKKAKLVEKVRATEELS